MSRKESLYELLRRQREETERDMARMQQEQWRREREKKEADEAKAERKHQELIEAMKNNQGININSGGDTNISGNVAGGNISTPLHPAAPEKPRFIKGVGKWIIGIFATIIGGLIVAYLKGCFPAFLK
jgi:hypothetical protein